MKGSKDREKHPKDPHRLPGARKSAGQTGGHYERDPKGRRGQFGGAGNAPLIKK